MHSAAILRVLVGSLDWKCRGLLIDLNAIIEAYSEKPATPSCSDLFFMVPSAFGSQLDSISQLPLIEETKDILWAQINVL